jgi:acyl CoA:acetate/3-ketoacid CoA transferase alpha subunit/acyl CoA:acetate/3-ketoacid CoA transferase beta subunit
VENEGENKVMSLSEAIRRNVKPGAKIHIGTTHYCPNAAILEIAKQFYGRKPGFTLIMRGIRDTVMVLLHMGLVNKVITSFSGNVYPWYGPNPVTQKAYVNREVELEDWSILTLPLMLMAGALGIGFMPTTSIVGSTMQEDNKDSFKVIDDPFGSGRRIGLLKALNPDLSLIHGVVADRAGNTILTAPYSESLWGAKASTGGVVVTVERLVSTDFIREHSHLVKLPGYMVNSVSVVPLGAHPGGVWNQGIEEFEAYAEDYAFMTEFNQICRDSKTLDNWIKEWVLDCQSFEEYKAKLSQDRILFLKGMADRDAWRYQLDSLEEIISEEEEYNTTEMMVIAAAREIKDKILYNHYKTALAGAGTANLATWIAKYQLQREGYTVELMVELGHYGNAPRPSEPFLLNFGNFPTCKMLTETIDTLGVFTCGTTNQCIGILGGGQVDKFGNINSSVISEDVYLTGSGGANDVASGAREVVLVMQQSRRRFLDKVPYITAPGARVSTLVSSMGVFEKLHNDEEFTLTKYFGNSASYSKEEAIKSIKENCGWDLKVSENPKQISSPTLEELRLLRIFDPKKYYLR